jgi:hypothetical protein
VKLAAFWCGACIQDYRIEQILGKVLNFSHPLISPPQGRPFSWHESMRKDANIFQGTSKHGEELDLAMEAQYAFPLTQISPEAGKA